MADRQIYVNLSVHDLKRSKEFFTKLGFEFNPTFTDDKGACMVIGKDAFVMLLSRPFFGTFTKKQICDTSTHTEAIVAVSCASRQDVDLAVQTAIASGGAPGMGATDHGFMYISSFYDPDGHHWEVMWMDPAASLPETSPRSA